jgi:hypothetical protein
VVHNRTAEDQPDRRHLDLFRCIYRRNPEGGRAELSGDVPALTNRRCVRSPPRIEAAVPEAGEASEQARCSMNRPHNYFLKDYDMTGIAIRKIDNSDENSNRPILQLKTAVVKIFYETNNEVIGVTT